MSNFRESQDKAHPNKTNVLMSGIILILVLILTVQIWLLYGTLNNALDQNFKFAIAASISSVVLFVLALLLLRYLPSARRNKKK